MELSNARGRTWILHPTEKKGELKHPILVVREFCEIKSRQCFRLGVKWKCSRTGDFHIFPLNTLPEQVKKMIQVDDLNVLEVVFLGCMNEQNDCSQKVPEQFGIQDLDSFFLWAVPRVKGVIANKGFLSKIIFPQFFRKEKTIFPETYCNQELLREIKEK